MSPRRLSVLLTSAALMLGAIPAGAQEMQDHSGHAMTHGGHQMGAGQMAAGHKMGGQGHAHGHGPIGVMGNHVMPRGKLMLSYRFGHMEMSGLRFGTNDISADRATTIPNRFAGMPGMPPTLRVIPEEMSMTMHMFGAMYGATDKLTLMAMLPYIQKDMTMITYQGPTGTTVLGRNTVSSEGFGDIRIAGAYGFYRQGRTRLTATLGLSLPTGSITETGQMLSPMGTTPTMRLAYSMQLGSGTYDLHPSLTWETGRGAMNWGGQLRGILRLDRNHAGYRRGHEAALTGWISYRAAPWISYSGRLEYRYADHIHGRDPRIMGPSLGADPQNYGGRYVTLYAGADITPRKGLLKGHLIGFELGLPIHQDLNGVQSETDWSLALAWRKPF